MISTRYLPRAVQDAYRWDTRSGWLSGLFSGMTVPFFGVIARRMGASPLEIALLISTPFLGHLLSLFVALHMQQRRKMPYVLWVGAISRGLLLFMAFATAVPFFIGLIIMSQIIGCFAAPAYAALMKDAYPDRQRGQLMGLVRVWMTIAAMLAGVLTGHLLDRGLPALWVLGIAVTTGALVAREIAHPRWRLWAGLAVAGLITLLAPCLAMPISYRVLFPIAAMFGLASLWMFKHVPEADVAANEAPRLTIRDSLGALLTDRRFLLYSLAFFIFGFGSLLQGPLVPLFQVDKLHIDDRWVGLLAMTGAGVSAIAYYVWGRLMDRYGPFITVVLSFAVVGFSPLVYAQTHHVSTLLVAVIFTGIGNPGVDLIWLNAVMHFTNRDGIPRYAALHTFLMGIRGLIAPFVSAWLLAVTHNNLRLCFYISATVIWVGTLAMATVVLGILLPAQRAARLRREHKLPTT